MKYFLILLAVLVLSLVYVSVMFYFTQIFFESLRLVGCHEVIRIGKREKDTIYELHYLNGRKRRVIPVSGSRMQRELERVAM